MNSPSAARRKIGRWMVRWRWVAALLLGVVITIVELIEHAPIVGPRLDSDFFQDVIGLGILVPFIIGACLTIVARAHSETNVIRITTRESERNRLARELHDSVGQNLAYVRLTLERLAEADPAGGIEQVQHEIRQLCEVMESACEQVRGKMVELRPPSSPDLATALLDYARVVAQRAHFAVNFQAHGQPKPVSEPTQCALFYLFREAMINIEKHAGASCVTIEVRWLKDGLSISLADDGTGFDPQAVKSGRHLGLQIMRERAQEINGKVTFRSARLAGTELALWLPLEAA